MVKVKDVERVEAESCPTAFERHSCGLGNAAELAGRKPDLGDDGHFDRLELLQNAAKVLFRFAIAVLHRGVEVIHASGDCPRDGTLLVGRIAAYHESADCAAAEAQHRELHSRAPKDPQLHRCSSGYMHNILKIRRTCATPMSWRGISSTRYSTSIFATAMIGRHFSRARPPPAARVNGTSAL